VHHGCLPEQKEVTPTTWCRWKSQICPAISSLLRKGITGASKSKINSNLNNKIISTPVLLKDLKNRDEKSKNQNRTIESFQEPCFKIKKVL